MRHYWTYLDLDRRQKRLRGLITDLAHAVKSTPLDEGKFKEVIAGLEAILPHLKAYEDDLKDVVRSSRFITGPGTYCKNDPSIFGRRGQVSGEARRSLGDLVNLRTDIERLIGTFRSLSGGRSRIITEQTKEAIENIKEYASLRSKYSDPLTNSVGFTNPSNEQHAADPIASIGVMTVMICGLLAAWLERRRSDQ